MTLKFTIYLNLLLENIMTKNSCTNCRYFSGQYTTQTWHEPEDYVWDCSNNNLSLPQVEVWENNDD